MRGLLVRDGENLPLEILDALDALPGDDDVAAQVAERGGLEVDALLARLDRELDEHGGAVDFAGVERVHELGPGAVADELDAYGAARCRERLRRLEKRQRVRDGQVGDADDPDAVFCRARRAGLLAAACDEEREQECEDENGQTLHRAASFQWSRWRRIPAPGSFAYFQPSAWRAFSMSAMICFARAFGSVLTTMTAPRVSFVSCLRNRSTFGAPCTGGSTQW